MDVAKATHNELKEAMGASFQAQTLHAFARVSDVALLVFFFRGAN